MNGRMERISAAANLTIEVDAERWRLLVNGTAQEKVLLEAVAGESIRTESTFAARRRLPDNGRLPVDSVQRVVLGWSADDESWHLGLLLEPELARRRGSRWCELARWPDPDVTVFSDVATRAGRALAQKLARPFNLIEPEVPLPQAPPPPPPLKPLPLSFENWMLEKTPALQFTRKAAWLRSHLLRLAWYTFLIVIYIALSVYTLRQIIALPKPEFLPYLGLATAAFLIILSLYTIWQILRQPNRMVVEPNSVRALHGKSVRWSIPRESIEAIYVTEVFNKKSKTNTVQHGELSLYLSDGTFRNLLVQQHPVDIGDSPDHALPEDGVGPLTLYSAHGDLQMAGLYIAQALNIECRYDCRLR
jgi:hypothetical protein